MNRLIAFHVVTDFYQFQYCDSMLIEQYKAFGLYIFLRDQFASKCDRNQNGISENCTAINKEKADSVSWNAVGQTIIIEYREKQRAGCRGYYFRCRRGQI